MKLLRPLVLASIFLLSLTAFADHQKDPCSPENHFHGSLFISWISCQANEDEVVIIVNGSPFDQDITGYQITSFDGQIFTFEQKTVNANCCIINAYDILRIHSGPGNNQPFDDYRDLHWLREDGQPVISNVWNDNGDVAQLLDFRGETIDSYEY